jgi:monofunctional biosynthetic peptidoglycan transglycosylase
MVSQSIASTTLVLFAFGMIVMAEETQRPLFDFTGKDSAKEWQTVNDGVMGGLSEGKFKITDQKTLEFSGNLSLKNNGGFASVRTKSKKLTLDSGDTIVARVRGDGREYSLNLYLNKPRIAFSYRALVQTKKNEWIEIKVPLTRFEATSFGRVLKDARPVTPQDVNAVGWMLSDKQAGPFEMEIEWIKVERTVGAL